MRVALIPHPDSICRAVTRIEADVERSRSGKLVLHYFVSGAIGDLRLPPVKVPARADELWRHSCFEAFVRAGPGDAYHEFNFAPSTEWAAYRFDSYRSGMSVATDIGPPRIEPRSDDVCHDLRASLELGQLGETAWRLGLSAVIEEANGCKSWWSLRHPPGKPDFHHLDSFAYELS